MKILLLGYGKEGQATENYFKKHNQNITVEILENFNPQDLKQRNYSQYDIIFRSPSVPPQNLANESSITKYFFENCPCPIIGVTATKGKGTTCSFIKSLLDAHKEDAHLVGNIGNPAIDVLDELKPNSIVVYEMSSFQLWDLQKSPHIAVIGTIEPDHLNVHKSYEDYKNAKANICRYQSSEDYCIYYQDNQDSVKIAQKAKNSRKIPYPFNIPGKIKNAIKIPGEHNVRNAIAAIAAVASFYNLSPNEYMTNYEDNIIQGLSSFKGLPHRLEFVTEKDNIKYYDDNFSTNPASTRVAIEAFPDQTIIPIIGGRDKTEDQDLPEIYEILNRKNIPKVILMGESGHTLYQKYQDERFILAESLEEAVKKATNEAKKQKSAVVLMSPSAASFDMFENVYDRGDQFKNLVLTLS